MGNYTVTLITAESEGGFQPEEDTSRRRVFAEVLSAARSEFYLAHQSGMQADIVFEVHVAEYAGENRVEYGGRRYRVLRTYVKRANRERMELVCNDLHGLSGNAKKG